jgi:lactoylglutathione lyase
MRMDHIGLWTNRLEEMREFYIRHFGCVAGPRYRNEAKGFSSYFLSFGEGARVELMARDAGLPAGDESDRIGYAHIAISVGSEEAVRQTTESLRAAGVPVVSEPRWTGDGYYESVFADPDGNRFELTI